MKNKGFTLIELLVVVAIIGILISICLLVINNTKQKAKDATVMTSINNANSAAYTCVIGGGTVLNFVAPGGTPLCSNDASMVWPVLPSGGPVQPDGRWTVSPIQLANTDSYTFRVDLFDGSLICGSTGCS